MPILCWLGERIKVHINVGKSNGLAGVCFKVGRVK